MEATENHPSGQPLGLVSTEGVGLAPERDAADMTMRRCREALAMLADDGDMCHWSDQHTAALREAVGVYACEQTEAERLRMDLENTRAEAVLAVAAERERWTGRLTERWHAGDGKGMTLREYMGMTEEEYVEWLRPNVRGEAGPEAAR